MAAKQIASPPDFIERIATITASIARFPVEPALAQRLTDLFSPESTVFEEIEAPCRRGIVEGWLCNREADGIRFGRALKATSVTYGLSVDVVKMPKLAGSYHRHPNGEIDMVMPINPGARFDGSPGGWKVYGTDSAHRPTVTGGSAVILYLLPDGAIEFSGG
jgi:hypothetical protein